MIFNHMVPFCVKKITIVQRDSSNEVIVQRHVKPWLRPHVLNVLRIFMSSLPAHMHNFILSTVPRANLHNVKSPKVHRFAYYVC